MAEAEDPDQDHIEKFEITHYFLDKDEPKKV